MQDSNLDGLVRRIDDDDIELNEDIYAVMN